jgi:hypothetical protein
VDSPDAAAEPTTSVASDDAEPPVEPGEQGELDLDAVERDLTGVEIALERLDAGTYRTDEIDGRPIPDEVLERDPTTRRAP